MCDQNDGLYNFKLNFALDVSKFRIGQNGKLENPTQCKSISEDWKTIYFCVQKTPCVWLF